MFPPEGGRHNNSDRTNIMFPPEGGRHNKGGRHNQTGQI